MATRYPAAPGVLTRDFVDPSRQNWEGTGPRSLRTTVWYPATPGCGERVLSDPAGSGVAVAGEPDVSPESAEYPLVLLSHGAGGSGSAMAWLGSFFASRGYLAAAVDHLGRGSDERRLAGQFYLSDWHMWERPRDLSTVLDRLLEDATLGSRVDRRRIGAAGFSAGGATVIFLAGGILDLERLQVSARPPPPLGDVLPQAIAEHEELAKTNAEVRRSALRAGHSYRDERVRSVFALAPAIGEGFTRAGLGSVRIPVRIVAGRADEVTPVTSNAQRYADMIQGAELTLLPGRAGHWTESDGEPDRGRVLDRVSHLALEFCGRTLARA